jgi:3'-5' exoribonuclease
MLTDIRGYSHWEGNRSGRAENIVTPQLGDSSLKKQFVRDLVVDVEVDSIFKVVSYQVRDTKAGQRFLALGIADRTGRIAAKRWDIAESEIIDGRGMRYVRVQGVVEDYRGARQVRLDQPLEDAADYYDPADYEPMAALRIEELHRRLDALIAEVREAPLRHLLHAFFDDPKFRARFDEAPAAKGIHHACRHGLLQHTVEVAEMVRAIADLQRSWGYAPVSRDLAVTGALLHDIGKIRELDWTEPSYGYTVTGNLLGHVTIGYQMVFTKISHIAGFPTALRDALLHIILSHHGKLEHGSPVTPMLREAQILTMADDLDARLFCMTEAAEECDDKDFGWHRAIEGGRVYAGSLGLGSTEAAPMPEEAIEQGTIQVDGHMPAPATLDLNPVAPDGARPPIAERNGHSHRDPHSPAAAILRSIGNGNSRYRR